MGDKFKQIIFLDIDGTLLDSKYRSNSIELPGLISSLQKTGKCIFVLNSNRSLEDIKSVAKQFRIEGLLVCENGAFIYDQTTKKTTLILDKTNEQLVKKFKKEYSKYLEKVARGLGYKIDYRLIDTVKYVSENSEPKKTTNAIKNSLLILDNIYRKYTISSHVRSHYDGTKLNTNLLKKLYIKMKKFIELSEYRGKIGASYSDVFGNLLFYSSCTSKAIGVQYVKKLYINSTVIAIGDEIWDANMIGDLGEFWAVKNASDEAKEHASHISGKEYAAGVFELLRRFQDEDNKFKP